MLVHRKHWISGPGEGSIRYLDWLWFKGTMVSWTRSGPSAVFPFAATVSVLVTRGWHLSVNHPLTEPDLLCCNLLFVCIRKKEVSTLSKLSTWERFRIRPNIHQVLYLELLCVVCLFIFSYSCYFHFVSSLNIFNDQSQPRINYFIKTPSQGYTISTDVGASIFCMFPISISFLNSYLNLYYKEKKNVWMYLMLLNCTL